MNATTGKTLSLNGNLDKDPARKRTFDPHPQVVSKLAKWERQNPGVRFGWAVNVALNEWLDKQLT